MATAWNGSDRRGGSAPVKPKVTTKKPSSIRGFVAGLVVVAAVCVAYFAFFSGSEKPQTEKDRKGRGRIKEVMPAAAPTNRVEELKEEKPPKKDLTKYTESYIDENGVERYKLGNGRVPKPVNTNNIVVTYDRTPWMPKFRHRCELNIATLLTIEPGDMIFTTPRIDEKYRKNFLDALMDPIKILDTDTEEQKAIKKAVEEEKHEIAKRIRNGEDLADILGAAYDEARRLAFFKRDVNDMVKKMVRDGEISTEQQVDEFCDAANKMLAEKGIAPVTQRAFLKRKLKLDRIRKEKQGESK